MRPPQGCSRAQRGACCARCPPVLSGLSMPQGPEHRGRHPHLQRPPQGLHHLRPERQRHRGPGRRLTAAPPLAHCCCPWLLPRPPTRMLPSSTAPRHPILAAPSPQLPLSLPQHHACCWLVWRFTRTNQIRRFWGPPKSKKPRGGARGGASRGLRGRTRGWSVKTQERARREGGAAAAQGECCRKLCRRPAPRQGARSGESCRATQRPLVVCCGTAKMGATS